MKKCEAKKLGYPACENVATTKLRTRGRYYHLCERCDDSISTRIAETIAETQAGFYD